MLPAYIIKRIDSENQKKRHETVATLRIDPRPSKRLVQESPPPIGSEPTRGSVDIDFTL